MHLRNAQFFWGPPLVKQVYGQLRSNGTGPQGGARGKSPQLPSRIAFICQTIQDLLEQPDWWIAQVMRFARSALRAIIFSASALLPPFSSMTLRIEASGIRITTAMASLI
jgi:hypothetical protein